MSDYAVCVGELHQRCESKIRQEMDVEMLLLTGEA